MASGPHSRYGAFVAKWDAEAAAGSALGKDLAEEFQSFQAWMRTEEFGLAMDLLGAFAAIVRLEMNRVYEPWYGKRERMSMEAGPAKAAWNVVPNAASSGSVSEEELKTYLTDNGCARPEPMPQ